MKGGVKGQAKNHICMIRIYSKLKRGGRAKGVKAEFPKKSET
jgi:hypothetical protein